MALEFVGGRTATITSSATSHVIPLTGLTGGSGTAPIAGDVVVFACGTDDPTDVNVDFSVAGYTELADLYANDTNDANLGAYLKVLSGADTTLTLSMNVSKGVSWAVHVWRGVDGNVPQDVAAVPATGINGGTPNAPSITTTNVSAVIAIGLGAGRNTTPIAALTAPAGMSNLRASREADGWHALAMASLIQSAVGAFDPPAFGGGSANTNNSWAAVTLALRERAPASAVPTDAVHGHVADSPALAPKWTISPDSAVSVHEAASPDIVAGLRVASAEHGHQATSPTLLPKWAITPAAATHAQAADSPTLIPRWAITVQPAVHSHQATSPTVVRVMITPFGRRFTVAPSTQILRRFAVAPSTPALRRFTIGG